MRKCYHPVYINKSTYFCCENLICIHTLIAERKRADKNGNDNAQLNTEITEKVEIKKNKSSKTSISIENLTTKSSTL